MRLAKLGKPAWNKGKTSSLETREKLRVANLGKTYSDTTKQLHRDQMALRTRNAAGQIV